jgi:hypothetical protein
MYCFSAITKEEVQNKLSKKIVIKIFESDKISNEEKIQKINHILSIIESECELNLYCKDNHLNLPIDKFNIPYWFFVVDNKEIEYFENNLGCVVNLIPNKKFEFILEQFELCENKSNKYEIECNFKLSIKKMELIEKNILGNYSINIE